MTSNTITIETTTQYKPRQGEAKMNYTTQKLTLEINMDNDAYTGNRWKTQVIRNLKQVIDQIADQDRTWGKIRDINGNRIGRYPRLTE